MGRHTWLLSNDWSTCTRCNEKLDHNVCNCCGAGSKHVCEFCIKFNKKGNQWNWAIGDNRGCDEHLQIGDVFFPPEYPDCEHIIAEKKAREVGW